MAIVIFLIFYCYSAQWCPCGGQNIANVARRNKCFSVHYIEYAMLMSMLEHDT